MYDHLHSTETPRLTAYTDVAIPQTVRTSIFGFRRWHPRKQRVQRHEGVS